MLWRGWGAGVVLLLLVAVVVDRMGRRRLRRRRSDCDQVALSNTLPAYLLTPLGMPGGTAGCELGALPGLVVGCGRGMRERGVTKTPDGLLSYRPLACHLVVLVSASFPWSSPAFVAVSSPALLSRPPWPSSRLQGPRRASGKPSGHICRRCLNFSSLGFSFMYVE